MQHDFDNAEFDRNANDPGSWIMRGLDLRYAAFVLRQKFDELTEGFGEHLALRANGQGSSQDSDEILRAGGLLLPCVMLQGYAVEVYLKALYISRGNRISENGRVNFNDFSGANKHHLAKMAKCLEIALTPEETCVLEKLSDVIRGFGRYPTMMNSQQAPLRDGQLGVWSRLDWRDTDQGILNGIFNRFERELDAGDGVSDR